MKKLNQARLERTLRDRLMLQIKENKVSGAQLLVMQNGAPVVSICEGYLNVDTQQPLRKDAMYRLASMTKPVTGVAALIAVERGWFQLTDNLCDHMPEFSNQRVARIENGVVVAEDPLREPTKIYQLLSHCNGLLVEMPGGEYLLDAESPAVQQSLTTITAFCATQPLAFEPGTYSAYSARAPVDVVARLIEKKSGMPYAQFLQENVFDPLGLKDFTYHPTDEQWARMLVLTDRTDGNGLVTVNVGKHTYETLPLTYTSAGVGLTATMHDYAIFAEMLRNRGSYRGVQMFQPERLADLTRAYVPDGTPGRDPISSWGLGVRVVVKDDVLPIGAFGWSGAYGTHFWVDPVNQITAIYLRGSRFYESGGCGGIGLQFERDVMACLEG